MEFDLKENAKNFINEALHCAQRAYSEHKNYPFAITHLIQGLELTLKSLLHSENEMLVFDDIDNPNLNKTVGIATALDRLVNFKIINLDPDDRLRIEKTVKFRNKITHFQFSLNHNQAFDYFLRLFEFLHYFYTKYLNKDLHDIIDEKHWQFEAWLLSQIKKSDFVHYHGTSVHKDHPAIIIDAQFYDSIKIGRKIYKRIKFGEETTFKIGNLDNCGDCGVKKGYFHTFVCDHEQCPKCGEQLIGFHKCDVKNYMRGE